MHFLSLKASIKGGSETALQDNSRKEEAVHSSSPSKSCEKKLLQPLIMIFTIKLRMTIKG